MKRLPWIEAIVVSWLILSPFSAAAVAAPFLMPIEALERTFPRCPRRPCLLCGMTHAFYRIAEGRPREAQRLNRGALAVFGFMVVNSLTWIGFIGRLLVARLGTKGETT